MRLIDVDALRKNVIEVLKSPDEYTMDKIEYLIDFAPTVNAETVEQYGKWVPVSKSLPEIFRDEYGELIPYLVCVNGTEYPFRAFYDGENWGDGWEKIDVIAWMPLPEPIRRRQDD